MKTKKKKITCHKPTGLPFRPMANRSSGIEPVFKEKFVRRVQPEKPLEFFVAKIKECFPRLTIYGQDLKGALFGESNFDGKIPTRFMPELEKIAHNEGFDIEVKDDYYWHNNFTSEKSWYLSIKRRS